LIRWHHQGFWFLWRWTSRPGRPLIPTDLQALIRANELLLKFGLRVSPRTVRKYLPERFDCAPNHGMHPNAG
jgi:putative transposase